MNKPRALVPWLLIAVAVVVVGVPVLMAVAWSLVDPDHPWSYPDVLPPSLSLFQWEFVFRVTGIVPAIGTSYLLAGCATVLAFLLALPMAYAIHRFDFRGKEAIRILMLLPLIIPGMIVALFLSRAFDFLGLSQTFLGLVLGHTLLGMPYMARLLTTSFEAIPRDVSDAASNLGASELVKFRLVYLPMVTPGIFAGGIFTFIASMEEFALTFVIGTPDYQTIPTVLFSFLGERLVRAHAAVVSLILLVPNMILLFAAERFLKSDFLASGYSKL
ncbi:spermidine/putrescine ABC transporter permease [Acrocarpospora corrugata]|uniref:Spermidine/putrescine ABC transporter permease n=1 Tax=Acrocarpospora corrugata TaxID=35763 RepID=A0A5M3W336_9ACTN|nr:ABC transporter permease [Acrocarpospora corrugata]GES01713.1 spermidine/putrescine ABC transporter permease [Acrocarpospora corrugata]